MGASGGGRFVGLLRGVNVGGKNRLPMAALAELCRGEGCGDVETYIQSGNVVFRASPASALRLPARLAAAIEARFGFAVPVQLRSEAELARVAADNPFLRAGAPPEQLHVAFLADEPGAALVAGLDAGRSPPDELAVVGREIHLRLPGGVAKSKLTNAWFDRRLGTVCTIRNWRTVLALLDLCRAGR